MLKHVTTFCKRVMLIAASIRVMPCVAAPYVNCLRDSCAIHGLEYSPSEIAAAARVLDYETIRVENDRKHIKKVYTEQLRSTEGEIARLGRLSREMKFVAESRTLDDHVIKVELDDDGELVEETTDSVINLLTPPRAYSPDGKVRFTIMFFIYLTIISKEAKESGECESTIFDNRPVTIVKRGYPVTVPRLAPVPERVGAIEMPMSASSIMCAIQGRPRRRGVRGGTRGVLRHQSVRGQGRGQGSMK